ncbi:MAG: SGNH/GDSL hydrolase family protein, partial [Vicinamibacterales bacterium]
LMLATAGLAASGQTAPAAPTAPAAGPARFEAEMAKFDDADRQTPVGPGGVVFTGSSSIRLWTTLGQDFAAAHPLNRGFGGSDIRDVIHFLDRVVLRYRPSQVVFYSGDNDLNGGRGPAEVAADYQRLVDAIHAALPRTRVVIISIKPSLARWAMVEPMRDTNRRVKAMVAADPQRLAFVDVFDAMLGPDGKPRPELYVADGLHMTPAGYAIWTTALRPALR